MLNPLNIKFFKMCCHDIGKETLIDISARCPVCGDSKKNKSIKRLHLYHKGGNDFVKCFNGDCPVNTNMYNFLRLYFPDKLYDYKRECFHQKIFLNDIDFVDKGNDKEIIETDDIPEFKTIDLENLLIPLEQSELGLNYLKSRNIDYKDCSKFGQFYFINTDIIIDEKLYKIQNSIVIPFYRLNKIYGFYSRKTDIKDFKTFNLNKDYKLWNWFNIDKEQPVYIFEGIFDALSSGKTNVIAQCGIDIPEERLKELKNPIFCLDNDTTGIKKMIEYAKDYNVLVYPSDFNYKDLNSALQDNKRLEINNYIQKGFKAVIELKKLL